MYMQVHTEGVGSWPEAVLEAAAGPLPAVGESEAAKSSVSSVSVVTSWAEEAASGQAGDPVLVGYDNGPSLGLDRSTGFPAPTELIAMDALRSPASL